MSDQAPLLRRALLKIEELQARLSTLDIAASEPIAVVGIGCRLPGGIDDPTALWQFLSDGRDAIGDIPDERWEIASFFDPDPGVPGKMYTRRGGFLADVDQFDPAFFGISPREAAHLDPQQRLLLETSWEALEHAGIAPLNLRGTATGVYIGQATNDYAQIQVKKGDPKGFDTYFATGTAPSVSSGRIAYTLGLQGPALTLDTACSSSLVALHLACQALRKRECDAALVGGVNLILAPEAGIAMCQSRMMAPDGICKTFDAAADGFGQAEGCVVVVVKRLSDATNVGDTVLALIRGSAVNQDGASSGLTAPNGPSQTAVIRAAFKDAGIAPAACGYVEAHGTGTPLGDPIEIQAMAEALGSGRPADCPLWTGSIKTNLGHLEAAAGLTGLLKVVLALHHGQIPPHLHLRQPNPLIPWEDVGVRVADRLTPFPGDCGHRVAGLSSFGFSGTNVHIVVQEAPPRISPAPGVRQPLDLLTLSARDGQALRDLATRYRAQLGANPDLDLGDIAFSANTGRSPMTHRIALIAGSAAQACAQLASFLESAPADGLQSARLDNTDPLRIAFLFAGQGSQYPDMGRSFYEEHPVFRTAFDDCDARFGEHAIGSLAEVVYGAPGGLLNQTQFTQPALFAIEWALAQLWRSWGIEPDLVIGHSIGEYVAACVAGVFSLDDAISLVATRAKLIGGLPPGGVMTAVMADEAQFAPLLKDLPQVSLAAVNGPNSAVLSGSSFALDRAEQRLAAHDIPFARLDVSHAFHSALLDPILDKFEAVVSGITMTEPAITFVSTFSGSAARRGAITNARYWRDQTRGTVRFTDALHAAQALGYHVFLELGPKAVLARFAARTLGDGNLCLATLEENQDAWKTAYDAVASLYIRGGGINWQGFHGAGHTRRALPTYPFQRSRFWLEPAAVAPISNLNSTGHPHIVRRTDSARGETIFDIRLDPVSYPYLLDHRVHGTAIIPTALYLDVIASAAAQKLGSIGAGLDDVVIYEAVAIRDQGCELQLLLGQDQFELFNREPSGWKLAVSGGFGAARITPGHAEVAGEFEPVGIDQFYPALNRIGLDFGPAFHRLETVRRRDGSAEGVVGSMEESGFSIHPAELDGCLQTIAAALPGYSSESLENELYMPIGIDRFDLYQSAHGALHTLATIEPASDKPEIRVGHLTIADLRGVNLAQITGVRMKRASIRPQRAPAISDLLYKTQWRQVDLAEPAVPGSAFPEFDGTALARSAAEQFTFLSQKHRFTNQRELEPIIDALCAKYILKAFAALGWSGRPGTVLAEDALIAQIAPRHNRLVRRLLAILVADGFIEQSGQDAWIVTREWVHNTPADIASLVESFPEFRPEILFAERGGAQLDAALRGEVDATEVLFPGGSFELADELYRKSPAADVFNQLVAGVVSEAIAQTHVSRPIRILEIGGGTGGVTSAMLPILPSDRTTYVFTDVSPAFLQKAAAEFAAFPFLRFELLDIEVSPSDQGFEPQTFDLVIASNVLHATADLTRAIDHARSLLAPGGQLLVIEGTKPVRWIDLSFGLTDGWWRFTDLKLRADYPLVSVDTWRQLLCDGGFSEPLIAPPVDGNAWVGQSLMLARADGVAAPLVSSGPDPLVFVDCAGAGDRLLTSREANGAKSISVRPGVAFGSDACGFSLDPRNPEDYLRLFDALGTSGPLPETIVFLWPVDAQMAPNALADALSVALERCCGALLYLLQAYAARAKGKPATLWIVTRRAQSVAADDRLDGLVQTALFGLVKVAALELPEIACHRIDLDELHDVDAVLAEMHGRAYEPIVAIRAGRRHVARLVPAPVPEQRLRNGYDLQIVEPGSFEGLALRLIDRPTLAAGDIEIRVSASGLNFRDVLNVIGARLGDSALGGEASGVITRLGSDVTGLTVGQQVMAVTYGGHREYASAPAALTLPQPATLDDAQAGGSPLVFLTALYALDRIGAMKPGERLLIHSAAGGVGMAAIQLAAHAGLEIFASAGSAAKREAVTAMGVAHVYDSRDLAFEDAILRDTGGEGIDAVLSAVTGPAIAAGLRLLRPGGRYLEIGKAGLLSDADARAINPDARYFAIDLADRIANAPDEVRPMFLDIANRLVRGELQPLPTRTFEFSDAGQAFQHMARARHVGKVVLRVAHQPLSASPVPATLTVQPHATYLISGGLTGLGLATARHLVERGARHLLLFGRRPPTAGAALVLDALRGDGVQVVVASADASSADDLAGLFNGPLREMPPLRGVIHSAGRLEDATLSQQSWSRFLAVLGPKAVGGWMLHQLCADQPLDFFVVYSSVSAILGAPGQSNHAAANAFIDGLATYRRARGLPALSINWGAWSGIGAAAGELVLRRLSGQGVAAINAAEGLAALERALGQIGPQIGVIRADWNRVAEFVASPLERRFLEALVSPVAAPIESIATENMPPESVRSAPLNRRASLLDALVNGQIAEVLGVPTTSAISVNQPFRDMGLDSLMALELRTRLKKALALDVPLPATMAFDYPTVAALLKYLSTDVLGWEPAQSKADQLAPNRRLVGDIEDMSDDEIDRILIARRAKVS